MKITSIQLFSCGEDKSPIMLVAFSIVFKINNIGKEIYKPCKNVVILTSTFENLIWQMWYFGEALF